MALIDIINNYTASATGTFDFSATGGQVGTYTVSGVVNTENYEGYAVDLGGDEFAAWGPQRSWTVSFGNPTNGVHLNLSGFQDANSGSTPALVTVSVDGVERDMGEMIRSGEVTILQYGNTIVDSLGRLTALNVIWNPSLDTQAIQIRFNIPVNSVGVRQGFYGDTTVGQILIDDTSPAPLPICFTSGTLIKTKKGEVPIECLSAGDLVLTMDHGYRPIRWIGSRKRLGMGEIAPVLIKKGTLRNDRDLLVSPQHRMLLQGWQAEVLFGEREVLVSAKSLINQRSIRKIEGIEVEYYHILFDRHEIVFANGAPSESFHIGEQGWSTFDRNTRDEVMKIFPELRGEILKNYGSSARMALTHKLGVLLGSKMINADAA